MLGIWLGKLAAFVLRLKGHKATSLPGKLALRVSPHLIEKLGTQLERCIVVTGTNGKTTTTSFLSGMVRQNEAIVTNAEGANLPQGIATVLLQNASWFGRMRVKTAVLEIDEATFPHIASYLPVCLTAVTNVFRDQLDRYGEVDTALAKIIEGVNQTNGSVLLNGDDPLARHIGLHTTNQAFYFGMNPDYITTSSRNQMRDGAFCLECGNELIYEKFIYGQLGNYRCPNCDFARPVPDFTGLYENGQMTIQESAHTGIGTLNHSISLPIRGLFNVYNALCATSAARVLGIDYGKIDVGVNTFEAPTGRMQAFRTDPNVILNLIKNPTGCDSVVQAICMESGPKVVCIGINDLAADGRDVSWLWDADFEYLAEAGSVTNFITTGFRAEDMALRLKYAGCNASRMEVIPEVNHALDHAMNLGRLQNIPVYVLTTYTLLHATADYLQGKATTNVKLVENRASVS
jgi:lipid II isoglutaminyl synthase (glutamine-hydrolysing)